jgi:hypothetical protein
VDETAADVTNKYVFRFKKRAPCQIHPSHWLFLVKVASVIQFDLIILSNYHFKDRLVQLPLSRDRTLA